MNQAIADSGAALRLDPNSAVSLRVRGMAELYAGRARAAADDFATEVRLVPADVLAAIWLHVARVRAQQQDVQEFRANIARVDRRQWPGPLIDVVMGEKTVEQVGDIALSSEGEKTKKERV